MMKRTFTVTAITILGAILFVSFHSTEFNLDSAGGSAVNFRSNPTVNMIPEELAGVYRGIRQLYVINRSESANLSPDLKESSGHRELNFIIIETGIIWLAESELRDSTLQHFEGSYNVTGSSQNTIEIKADFRVWNKQGKTFFIRFDRDTGKAAARAEGEPEFELQHIR